MNVHSIALALDGVLAAFVTALQQQRTGAPLSGSFWINTNRELLDKTCVRAFNGRAALFCQG